MRTKDVTIVLSKEFAEFKEEGSQLTISVSKETDIYKTLKSVIEKVCDSSRM